MYFVLKKQNKNLCNGNFKINDLIIIQKNKIKNLNNKLEHHKIKCYKDVWVRVTKLNESDISRLTSSLIKILLFYNCK